MKKFVLMIALVMGSMSMMAETIYSGSEEINWNGVAIDASNFLSLGVADQIVVNITYVDGQEWPQVALRDGWWNDLPGAGSVAIDASTTQVIYYATTAMIAVLQELGMVVTGCGFILNSVELVATESDDDMSGAIWIGNEVFGGDWSDYTVLPASCFDDAAVGNYLRFHYKDLGAGAYLSVRNGSWEDLSDAPGVTPEGSYTKYEITDAMLTELQEGGAIVMGTNFTLTYVDLSDPLDTPELTLSVGVTNNWIFENGTNPYIEVKVTNGTEEAVTANAELLITTDKYEAVTSLKESATVEAGKVITIPFEFTLDDPGFYRVTAMVNDELARAFVIGVEPEKISSPVDAQDDFDSFWQTAKEELATVEINATMTKLDDKSTSNRDVYLVEFYSIPDETGGEPVVIRGYYAEPVEEGSYPTILHVQGYDNGELALWCMGGNDLPGYCELILSTRGQLINNREPYTNTYGDWFQFNFGYKDKYYYRSAYMDVVRAIDLLCSRDKVDQANLFIEGQSQGGAFTYAGAALSNYPINAVAPAIPFMGDFPDYFELASWPANVARMQQEALGMSDEEMYEFLSYFDTKNLAPKVSAAVIETIGLVDTTCPPHTNIAPYNNLSSDVDKQISYNPLLGHEVPSNWYNTYMAFFQNHMVASGIESVATNTSNANSSALYNLAGQEVTESYRGVVIKEGKKILKR